MSAVHFDQAPPKNGVVGVSYPGPNDVWEASPSLKNIKYTKMHHSKKIKNFFLQWGPARIFFGPAVALDVPDFDQLIVNAAVSRTVMSNF